MKAHIQQLFRERFGADTDPLIVRSPGRVNIIGEHTDYNEGFVLPAAIDKAAYIALTLREDDSIHLYAQDLNESFTISMHELKPVGDISWPNFLLGVAAQFQQKNIAIRGFNALLMSDVPIGAGLSSSAAIECATAFALNALLQTGIDKIELVKMAQKSEHEFAGVKCGIMDQFASMMGQKDHVLKIDCRSLQYALVPFALKNTKIVLLNTNVKHSLASSEYNTRRMECEQGIAWISEQVAGIQSLRDVGVDMIHQYLSHKDPIVTKRCLYVVEEIQRLEAACRDLEKGDIAALGKKMFATHKGLSEQYEVSCKELDLLISYVQYDPAVIGARMMGGGFGGCTINLVKEDAIEALITRIQPAYELATGLPLTFYIASIENGTEIIA